MANIFINALKSKTGGGKNILDNYIQRLVKFETTHIYYVLTPQVELYESYNTKNVFIIDVPTIFKLNIFFPLLYFFEIPILLKKYKIDLILNFGDVIIPSYTKQVYFFDWAYAVYNEDYIWNRMAKKDWVIRRVKVWLIDKYIKKVTLTVAQTQNIIKRLQMKYGLKNLSHIPTPVGVEFYDDETHFDFKLPMTKTKFLFPASFASHKNFEVIIPLVKLIKANSLPYVIILTIDESSAKDFMNVIKSEQLTDGIFNVGKVDGKLMPSLYKQSDALLLPTLLESYGLPYVEAMAYGKPIITSDLDFAHDVCSDIAIYFNPFDAKSILRAMQDTVNDNYQSTNLRIEKGKKKMEQLPNWEEVFLKFQENIESSLN